MSEVGSASECTLRGALPLVLGVSRLLGVAPVRFTRTFDGRRSARVAPRLLPYSYFHFCVFSVYSLLSLILRHVFHINLSLQAYTSGAILWTCTITLLGSTVTSGVCGVQSRMDAIIGSLNAIEPIHQHYKSDKFLRRLYIKEIIVFLVSLFVISFGLFRWVIYYINVDKEQTDLWKIILPSYLYLFCLSSLLLAQFAMPALRVTAALQAMNHSLRELLFLVDLSTQNSNIVLDRSLIVETMRIEKQNKKVKQLKVDVCGSIRHLSTCFEAVQRSLISINDSFGVILILNYSFLLLFITVTPYRLVMLQLKENVGLVYAMAELIDIGMYFLYILVGVQPGHEIEREVSRMRCTVSELLSRAASRVVQSEQEEQGPRGKQCDRGERDNRRERTDDAEVLAFLLSVLSKQLAVPDLCFAPFKFFKLRRPLVPVLMMTSVSLTLILMDTKKLQ